MKRSSSEKNGLMYVQRRLNKRKAGSSSVKTRADAINQDMKEDDIVYGSKAATFSNMSKKAGNAMSTLFKALAFLCIIYDMDFRSLAEKQKLGVEEELSRVVDLVLAESPYTLRTAHKYDHAEYDVFGSSDMKGMDKVFGAS